MSGKRKNCLVLQSRRCLYLGLLGGSMLVSPQAWADFSCAAPAGPFTFIEGDASIQQSYVCTNSFNYAIDVLWMNQSEIYLYSSRTGDDTSDSPALLNVSVAPGRSYNGTDYYSVVAAGAQWTVTFTIDPSLDGVDDNPYDSGNRVVQFQNIIKPDRGAFWTNLGYSPQYVYTAFDGWEGQGTPEPDTWALMAVGFAALGAAGYWRSKTAAA